MVTMNSFDLLGDVDNDDPTQVIALIQQKLANRKSVVDETQEAAPAKFPSKPSQAGKEARKEGFSGPRGGYRDGAGRGQGGRGSGFRRNSDSNGNANGFSGVNGGVSEDNKQHRQLDREDGSYRGSRQPYRGGRGGRRGGHVNGESGGDFDRTSQRQFDRQSRNGHGYDRIKRDGAGRGNWGPSDGQHEQKSEEIKETEGKELIPEKVELGDAPTEANKEVKEGETNEVEKEPEDKEMTLEEYEKVLEEKRKALVAMKSEERKVDLDKELESMQQLSVKKENNEIFIKLGSDKDSGKRKEDVDRDERVKKSVSINEFLKPAEGERHYRPGGRRGRGRGDREQSRSFRGGYNTTSSAAAPSIQDPAQFPNLGGK